MKIVIRAGGNGTRLWPMSRVANPKQFQAIVGDKSMVRTTFDRVLGVTGDKKDIFVSINSRFNERIKKELPDIPEKNIIVETDARNTGPAMCLEVCFLNKYCSEDEVIASLPSDDFISDSKAFKALLLSSEEFIQENPDYILTPAIRPYYIDTGYSYFKAGKNLQQKDKEAIYRITQVVEKPNYDYCEELVKSGVYYCHTGMYLWQLKHIDGLFKKHQPGMYESCTKVVELVTGKKYKKAQELYSQLEKITIESAITEKTDKIAMSVSDRIGWSDLGKWHIIKKILAPDDAENLVKGEVIVNEAKNNLIYSNVKGKVVAVNDLEDIVVVDTEDALFVSSLKNSAEVKEIVKKLKAEGREEYV